MVEDNYLNIFLILGVKLVNSSELLILLYTFQNFVDSVNFYCTKKERRICYQLKVLNSKLHPKYWETDFAKRYYIYIIPSYNFEEKEQPGKSDIYNTTQKRFCNEGNYFGYRFTSLQRHAFIEYLKTL